MWLKPKWHDLLEQFKDRGRSQRITGTDSSTLGDCQPAWTITAEAGIIPPSFPCARLVHLHIFLSVKNSHCLLIKLTYKQVDPTIAYYFFKRGLRRVKKSNNIGPPQSKKYLIDKGFIWKNSDPNLVIVSCIVQHYE